MCLYPVLLKSVSYSAVGFLLTGTRLRNKTGTGTKCTTEQPNIVKNTRTKSSPEVFPQFYGTQKEIVGKKISQFKERLLRGQKKNKVLVHRYFEIRRWEIH